ncbi:siroheme decarboxylase subunit beta [Amphritea sp. HPY]|uniref:siroheme decarboxylase subunit beta n=1 Tax=Amphritea sp. HPY TaxID=3421652 RepID=UPI003D7D28D3
MNAHFNPLDPIDLALLHLMQEGLPLIPRPYAALAEELGCSEELLAERLTYLQESKQLRRSGLIIRHRPLGFKANAMVVWNLPNEQLQAIAEQLAVQPCVTLCYERPRRLPDWPYNLFTMIHGRSKEQVREQLAQIIERLDLQHIEHDLLFSETCYKQCGGRYLQKKNQEKNQEKEAAKGVAVNG